MSTIFFIAVQCCQCSTMQVKQRKNSSNSNKWTCVVCNQKQSIRKVFAQSPMAKDLRPLAQSFNMSRQFPNTSSEHPPPSDEPVEVEHKRGRTDWTEYLDPNEEIYQNTEPEDRTDEPEIVTELPMGLFKKAKLNNYDGCSRSETRGGGNKLYRHVFSERNGNKQVISQDKQPMRHYLTTSMDDTSKWSHETRDDHQKPRKCQLIKGRDSSSKWSEYLIQDDDDSPRVNAGKLDKHIGDWSNNILQALTNEETVEDDEVHPDFL
ncbi:hypothetical protein TorRG33x02_078790 [Trema orientale]|uniref:MRN complex-interacting protein N-terminal domain-containing protein n=1 Tax=Trema orientale TaxID=63057 RepID=A0A2P5FES7_TREOI|nr:hypothetical protein TorRG33x02_078790 [Trema orientale]